jgi:hypothetical protein
LEEKWCIHDRIWFSGPDKQEIFILEEKYVGSTEHMVTGVSFMGRYADVGVKLDCPLLALISA